MDRQIKPTILKNLKKTYGHPSNIIPFTFLERNEKKKTLIKEENIKRLSQNARQFYEAWKRNVYDPYQTLNAGGVCFSCYTFLTKGGVSNVSKFYQLHTHFFKKHNAIL
jgi:hypothetical protein